MNIYAPVLIITLNRYEHFKRCVESLSACTDADKTDLYIAFDYPANENHWEGYWRIEDYLTKIQGFKSVIIFKRSENFGPVKNHLEAQSKIFETYDRIILSEDDNEFSPNFLDFVNKGLNKYKDNSSIFSVSGYNYPLKIPQNYNSNIYIWCGFSAWGVGLWRDKWQKIDWNVYSALQEVRIFLKNYKQVYKLNKIANHYVPALILMLKNNVFHGDGYICLYQFQNNMNSIFPTISRVRNMGHDGSGVNCKIVNYDIYKEQKIYMDSKSYSLHSEIMQNKSINNILRLFFKNSIKSQAKSFIKLLLINLGLSRFF